MVQSTARVLNLLEILQTGGTRTMAELADRLEVDRRTVRRYVDHLRDLDIPVDSVRGRYGGYRLAPHYRMPPLMLTDEEALAVTWALVAAGSSGSGPVSPSVVENAAGKIRRIMPAVLRQRIEAVLDAVDFADARERIGHVGSDGTDQPEKALFDLSKAARDESPVSFEYTPRSGHRTHREVHPYGLVAHHGSVYLAAFDFGKQAARTFRLDRIARVRPLNGIFTRSELPDTRQQVLGPLSPDPNRVDVSVLLETDAEQIWAHIPRMFASVTPVPDHHPGQQWVRLFLRVESLDWVARRLAVIDRPFVIERPTELIDALCALGQRLLAATTLDPSVRKEQSEVPGDRT